MARRPPPPPPQANLTATQMRQGIQRLNRCIAAVEGFDPTSIRSDEDSSRADALSTSVDAALAQTFGHGTVEYNRYSGATMFSWPLNMVEPTPIHRIQESLTRCRKSSLDLLSEAVSFLEQELEFLPDQPTSRPTEPEPTGGTNIVIGHGRSPVWRELKDFIEDRLHLPVDEFNSTSAAGIPTTERLRAMLNEARFAFLVMTAEDEQADGKLRARENVVHEVGLFQGRLGFQRAIILLEQGCDEFSNIRGLGQIRFPRGNISASLRRSVQCSSAKE